MVYEVTAHTEGAGTVDLRVAHCPDSRGLPARGWTDGPVSPARRAVRSAAVVLLLLSPMALSGCSAGQVTRTATQARDRTGGAGQVQDIGVHAVRLVHPSGGVHVVGD